MSDAENYAQELVNFLTDKEWNVADTLATLAFVQLIILEKSGVSREDIEKSFLFNVKTYFEDCKS